MTTIDTTAQGLASFTQRQYFERPADQKFSSLDDLRATVEARRQVSVVEDLDDVRQSHFYLTDDGTVAMGTPNNGAMVPTHWGFGQAASLTGAPAYWLRQIGPSRPDLVVDSLNAGLALRAQKPLQGGLRVLAYDDPAGGGEPTTLQAITSQSYGRIWDADVVAATTRILEATEGRFESPWAWGRKHRALFASEHDIHLMFVDGGSLVEGGGERDALHRGFTIWNSEVGASVLGIAAFAFRVVCGNFLIHGISDVKLVKVRHTSGGPERFVTEAVPALRAYLEESAKPLETAVRAAKAYALPRDEAERTTFFLGHGFTRAEIARAVQAAEREEGQCATLWDAVNGFTATARDLAFADARTNLERRAGRLLEIVQ